MLRYCPGLQEGITHHGTHNGEVNDVEVRQQLDVLAKA
jgi:hypothetical protein